MPASEKYVTVHRSYDPIIIEMLGDILRQHGIAARVLGTRNGAIVGVAQTILQLHIEVPQSQAGEATEFIEDFVGNHADDLPDDDYGDDDDGGGDRGNDDEHGHAESESQVDRTAADDRAEPESRRPRQLRPLFAAAVSLVFTGLGVGHLYGRRPYTGLLIAIGFWTTFFLGGTRATSFAAMATVGVTLAALLMFDLLGSQQAVRAWNRGGRVSVVGQLGRGVMLVAAATLLGKMIGPHVPPPERSGWMNRYYDAPVELPPPQLLMR